MGKQVHKAYKRHDPHCVNQDAPICGNESCSTLPQDTDNVKSTSTRISSGSRGAHQESPNLEERNQTIKELVIVGAGPHALTLLLRLLEPDPDFLSDKVRHQQAEYLQKMRPVRDVHRHIKDISRGPAATLKTKKKKKNKKCAKDKMEELPEMPPPLSLRTVLDSVQVIDAHGDWLVSWKQNFEAIGISQLRSLMNAHADPYDHRSLEYYAEAHKRREELVTLKELTQRDNLFRGPYQVPTTRLFHDFNEALIQSYGIKNVVQKGKVISITPMKDPGSDENIFEVQICNGDAAAETTTVQTRRCVCALGPSFSEFEFSWEKLLRQEPEVDYPQISKRILRSGEIVQWLQSDKENNQTCESGGNRLLIVGGGITSAQLALGALKTPFFKSVLFIQRSQALPRHFDVKNEWMGPKRGKILDEFLSSDMKERPKLLKEARKGGSIPPELLRELYSQEKNNPSLLCREEIEIHKVEWVDDEFHITFDDDSTANVDFIWLATGCEHVIDKYPVLDNLVEVLPMATVNGLPVLSKDLSWVSTNGEFDESKWKNLARQRFYCMGSLAGLQLGPDALNLVGGRHGAVKIAKSIRDDMS